MSAPPTTDRQSHARRRDERGSSTVAALTLAFVFMAGGFIWLSRTVDQSINDRSQAAAVAFHAARAAAQQIDPAAARRGQIVIDSTRAVSAARQSVAVQLAGTSDSGVLESIQISGRTVTVVVVIDTTGRTARGSGSATASIGFDDGNRT
ncbi:MAG TPA: hypothetical protein PKV27_02305 [Ilumatobacteraceae bacterium]|nr:hypothetical protein [Ilumatobacteraceae bacterium]